MKQVVRAFTRRIVNVTRAVACDTFGDTASLSPGPCERCVGRALAELPQEIPPANPVTTGGASSNDNNITITM